MTTSIDLSRVPAPKLLESVDFEPIQQGFVARFLAKWALARAKKPTLPAYDVELLETDPAIVIGQAVSELRLLDRIRVNDAALGLLAPTAKGSDLANIVAGQGIERLVVIPATPTSAAIMESDEALLRRYLFALDRPAVGSISRYLLEAWTVWPSMLDARVNGRAIHGRKGDTDLVVIGPGGRDATDEELASVRAAISAPDVQPEGCGVAALRARRATYAVDLLLEVGTGPDPSIVRDEAMERVRAAAADRIRIGGEIPAGFLRGAAFGANVIDVVDRNPIRISPDPYAAPVPTGFTIDTRVRT